MTLMLPPDTDFEQENCFQRFLVKTKEVPLGYQP